MSIANDKEARDRWQEDRADRERSLENFARHAEPQLVIGEWAAPLAAAQIECGSNQALVERLEALERYLKALDRELIGYRLDRRLEALRQEIEFLCTLPELDRAAVLRACQRTRST